LDSLAHATIYAVEDPISDAKDIFRAKDWRGTMLMRAYAIAQAVEGFVP